MYRIDTHQARTDLYGIGKGAAQVIDPSIALGYAKLRQEDQHHKDEVARAEGDKNLSKVYSQLQTVNKDAVMARDLPKFTEQQNQLYDYVQKNIAAARQGDSTVLLNIQKMTGDLFTQTELSKNTRELTDQEALKVASDPTKYRPESLAYFKDFVTNPKNAGNYNFDPSQLKQNINYMDRTHKVLSPLASDAMSKSAIRDQYTLDQANGLVKQDVMSDPNNLEQATYDFNNAQDKMGATTPTEFYQKRYAPLLVRDNKKEPFYNGFPEHEHKEDVPSVAGTFVKTGEGKGTLNLKNAKVAGDNPYMSITDSRDPKKSLDVKLGNVTIDGENTHAEGIVKLSSAEEKANREAEDAGEPKPYKEVVRLNYKETADILHNKFKINNVFDIPKGKIPKHVDIKTSDISKPSSSSVKSGDVVGGYKFLGGDPNDQNNWQKSN